MQPRRTSRPPSCSTEHYRGIRPAPGYPAQPDHTEKATLFRLLDAEKRDRREADGKLRHVAGARRSAGFISRIPRRIISASAKIERDQVEDYARRKGMPRRRGRALAGADIEL